MIPTTFFADDNVNVNGKSTHYKQLKDSIELNKIIERGLSQSLVASRIENNMKKFIENKNKNKKLKYESHIEHGICAVLQNIVSHIPNVSKYSNIKLLYQMSVYTKNKTINFQFIHTYKEKIDNGFIIYV